MAGNTRPFGELFAESARNGLTRPKAVRGSGVKMVNMGELFAHPRLFNVPMDRVPLSQSEAERLLLEDGDVLFARQSLVLKGAGKCSIFLRDDEPVTFESHVARVRLDPKKAHPGYYFYYLQSYHGRSAIRSIVEQGAGASGIRGSDLATLEVLWRPLSEQRAIAHILGTLDDKIELNRRANETLEAVARALFKSWFVDFDPVRAKMEGRDPGLPQHLADLFPDRLVDSELGQIPEGWKTATLGDHVDNFDSKRVPVSGAERAKRQGPFPYHGAAGVMDHIDNYLFDGIYPLIGEDGSVIHESGLAVTQYVWGKFWVNNHAHVLQGKGPVSTEQVYLYFHFEPVAPYVTGAVQPKLSQGRMNNMPFLFPGAAICKGFLKVI